jgi:hypothetical protein
VNGSRVHQIHYISVVCFPTSHWSMSSCCRRMRRVDSCACFELGFRFSWQSKRARANYICLPNRIGLDVARCRVRDARPVAGGPPSRPAHPPRLAGFSSPALPGGSPDGIVRTGGLLQPPTPEQRQLMLFCLVSSLTPPHRSPDVPPAAARTESVGVDVVLVDCYGGCGIHYNAAASAARLFVYARAC